MYESPAPSMESAEGLNAGAGRPVAVKCMRSCSDSSVRFADGEEMRGSKSES